MQSTGSDRFAADQGIHGEKLAGVGLTGKGIVDSSSTYDETNVDTGYDGKPAQVASSEEPQKGTKEAPSGIRKFRDLCGKLVNATPVQTAVIVMIIVNSIMMGVATFPFVMNDDHLSRAFELTDMVFLSLFTLELAMQIIYHGFDLFLDGWLVFDFFIVFLSWGLQEFQIIRAFRIFRALRLVTRVEIMRDLVTALFSVMPRMVAIAALLLLIFYVFAVMFTQLFKDLELEEPYFVTLDASLFTLFQMMTLDWAGVARECMAVYFWAWIPFVAFILISSFIVFNLVIAVICDAVAFVHEEDESEEEQSLKNNVDGLREKLTTLQESQVQLEVSLKFLTRQIQLAQLQQP